MSLNEKQRRFAAEYLIDLNAKQAAIRAGYSQDDVGTGRFYVYCLIDPQDGRPFYVGKGTGKRMETHVRNARAGIVDNAPKYERILGVLSMGLSVVEEKILQGLSEGAAFEFERLLIDGIDGLCNIAHGCVTNDQKQEVLARALLSRMKSFEDWIASAPMDRVEQGARIFGAGSARRCYNRFAATLAGLSQGDASC